MALARFRPKIRTKLTVRVLASMAIRRLRDQIQFRTEPLSLIPLTLEAPASIRGTGLRLTLPETRLFVGSTGSSNFPVFSAYQSACGGCANGLTAAFVTMFDPAGTALTYSTYLGGTEYPSGAAGDSASMLHSMRRAMLMSPDRLHPPISYGERFQSSCAGGFCQRRVCDEI